MRPKVFINTRFNIVLKGNIERVDKAGSTTGTDAWLARRFDLFERVCLPSLMAQTDADFHWLVFFSDGTPEPFLTRIDDLHQRFPAFIPCFLKDGEMQVRRYRQEVKKLLTSTDTHIISARIDNDDAFHVTYVEHLRAEFHGQDDEMLNFLNGIQYDMDGGVVADLRKYSNPFIARIERIFDGQVKTVLDVMHHQAQDTGLLRDVDTIPMWLQLIHSGNVLNSFASGRVRYAMDLEKEFGIKGPVRINKIRSFMVALNYRLYVGPMRVVRAAVRRVIGRG